ncbi:MAG: hypothetical protein ISEC1_P0426 [Thiomicrorhabdus sp.]|nr:MAG: hypothetical protein ISEC1_P0426 [Thiomicrorhabdus sp.]
MKLHTLVASTVVAASLLSTSAMAQNSVNPWKQCGIGAMIFDDNSTAAAISNVIWDLGTTAVSSNISSQDSCEGLGNNVAAAEFIQNSHAVLEEEIVNGSGAYLSAVLKMFNVSEDQMNVVAQNVKQNFAKVVTSSEYENLSDTAKAQTIYNVMLNTAKQA